MSLMLKDIAYQYPNTEQSVLQGLSISFADRQITAIMGNNGCGKTTLVKLMIGMLKPSSGQILLDGTDLSGCTIRQRGQKIGCVMQNPSSQIIGLSVFEEVAYGLKNQGLSEIAVQDKVRKWLDYFDLSSYKDAFPLHLSMGERQRLLLAAFLAMETDYIVLDEPTASLDYVCKNALAIYLKKSSERGCGVIMVSHDKEVVKKVADRVCYMKNGCFAE